MLHYFLQLKLYFHEIFAISAQCVEKIYNCVIAEREAMYLCSPSPRSAKKFLPRKPRRSRGLREEISLPTKDLDCKDILISLLNKKKFREINTFWQKIFENCLKNFVKLTEIMWLLWNVAKIQWWVNEILKDFVPKS